MAEVKTVKEQEEEMRLRLNAYEGDEPFIFVSYSHADTMAVLRILKILDKEKFRFWYDDTMEIGEDFRNELRDKIEKCSAMLLFISDASMQSKYCGMEVITAYKYDKRIYPVYISEDVVIPPALKLILENLQHVKGAASENLNKYVAKLISSLPVETMKSLETDGEVLVKCKDGSTSLTVPAGIKIIGDSAFKNCEKLENIDFGDEVEVIKREAFRGCKGLKHVVLPESVRRVGDSVFRDCIAMESLVVENDEIELGERTFENCASLSSVKLRMGMTELYGGVFNSCKSLVEITLPEKLTVLGESSFADCVKLKKIVLPPEVSKVDDMAFNGCIELEEIVLNDKISKLGKNVFKDCKCLKSFYLPASVTSIGTGPFRGCSNLRKIVVDPKSRFFKAVDSVLFNKNKSVLISYPAQLPAKNYSVPDSVTVISDWAFCECSELETVFIPDSVYEIGEGAFYTCSALKRIEIPDSVVKIDDIAFRGCTNLESIVIPSSVKEFGWGIFNGCENVTVICSDDSQAAKYCDIRNIPHRKNA